MGNFRLRHLGSRGGAVVAALAVAFTGTVAEAQLGDVGETLTDATGYGDTDATPLAKESVRWDWAAGAKYRGLPAKPEDLPEGSATPFELDLFDVSFRDKAHGFAGGAECEQRGQDVKSCSRVPVIYAYTVNDVGEGGWAEMFRAEGRGFVGAIAWLDDGRALAVGGDGCYPRREAPCPDGETAAGADPAGNGRAWLFEGGGWRELVDLPPELGGMTALDASPRKDHCDEGLVKAKQECAFAGALGAIWHWRDGKFVKRIHSGSPTTDIDQPAALRFRVRDVRIGPSCTGCSGVGSVYAVTGGCCAADGLPGTPQTIHYEHNGRWTVRPARGTTTAAGRADPQPPTEPESFYSVTPDGGVTLATPGGPAPDPSSPLREPATRVVGDNGQLARFDRSRAATSRLVSVDSTPAIGGIEAVGVLAGTGQGLAYGAPEESVPERITLWKPTDSAGSWATPLHGCKTELDQGCDPNADRFVRAQRSLGLFKLPSYALNSVQVVDKGVEGTGAGWAVGDHGAILSLAGQTAAAQQSLEPPAPELGARKLQPLDTGAYDPYRAPATAEPGTVPPLAARPLERLIEPGFRPAGSPSPFGSDGVTVRAVAMSRDGGEGWAVADSARMFRYDGASWTECATTATAARAVPQACAALAPLRTKSVKLLAMARVPLERDDEPANDDDFELVAVGSRESSNGRWVVARYLDGAWALDEDAMDGIGAAGPLSLSMTQLDSVAFHAPDDGWVAGNNGSGAPIIFHLDRHGWVRCGAANRARCGDPEARLPVLEGDLDMSAGAGTLRGRIRIVTAGARVYMLAARQPGAVGSNTSDTSPVYPMIIYREPGGDWRGSADGSDAGYDPGYYAASEGEDSVVPDLPRPENTCDGDEWTGQDRDGDGPCSREADGWIGAPYRSIDDGQRLARGAQGGVEESKKGRVYSIAVSPTADGKSFEGWAVGEFGGEGSAAKTSLLRLERGQWSQWRKDDAAADYLAPAAPVTLRVEPWHQVALPEPAGDSRAFIFAPDIPSLAFDERRQRWEGVAAPFLTSAASSRGQWKGSVSVAAPDRRGGLWLSVAQNSSCSGCDVPLSFFRYGDSAPRPVFREFANPVGAQEVTAAAGGADGSFWVATASNVLHRYDRLTGWDRVAVPGWDPGRTTRPSRVNALAVGPDGRGIAVGDGGRIARIGPEGAELDAAAGTVCEAAAPAAPCGTGRELTKVAVGPEGSAVAAGQGALLWRPAGGELRRIEGPRVPRSARVSAVALPSAERMYLAFGDKLYAGDRTGDDGWSWRLEGEGDEIAALAVDPAGRGYAVGPKGLVLERTGDGAEPWRRIDHPYNESFQAVAIPPGGGPGALIGAEGGLLLTVQRNRLEVARPIDPFDPLAGSRMTTARVAGVALAPGMDSGDLEAWAALQEPVFQPYSRTPLVNGILHYASDEEDALLEPMARAAALPDAPPARAGELSFAAFGKQECHFAGRTGGVAGTARVGSCPEPGGRLTSDVIAARVSEELVARAQAPGGPALAVFTGDIADAPGGAMTTVFTEKTETPVNPNARHRRWAEIVADRVATGGLPLLGAIGNQDLSSTRTCGLSFAVMGGCGGTAQLGVGAGSTLPWREAMAAAAPWQSPALQAEGALQMERVGDSLSQPVPQAQVDDPDGDGPLTVAALTPSHPLVPSPPRARARVGPIADTHYAIDASLDGRKVARIVVVDTSLRSLVASDAQQEPVEPGGQSAWVERMLCVKGSVDGTETVARSCTREPGQPAVVVSNAPTYTYANLDPAQLQQDASAFEAILLRHGVSAVVSGRLGWNGRYWATAPGLHEPCPGGAYQTETPEPGAHACGRSTGEAGVDVPAPEAATQELAGALGGLGAPLPPEVERAAGIGGQGVLPFVVAGSAGGRFGPDGGATGTAAQGFWRGYSIVRVDPSGDPRKTIVEQRPVLDWIAIRAQAHVLRPGQRMTLRGYGREPSGNDTPIRYIEIDSPAVTHRYDLLLADRGKAVHACQGRERRLRAAAGADRDCGSPDRCVAHRARWRRAHVRDRAALSRRAGRDVPDRVRAAALVRRHAGEGHAAAAASPGPRAGCPAAGPADRRCAAASTAAARHARLAAVDPDDPGAATARAALAPGRAGAAHSRRAVAESASAATRALAGAAGADAAAATAARTRRQGPSRRDRPEREPPSTAAGQPRPTRRRSRAQGSKATPGRHRQVRGGRRSRGRGRRQPERRQPRDRPHRRQLAPRQRPSCVYAHRPRRRAVAARARRALHRRPHAGCPAPRGRLGGRSLDAAPRSARPTGARARDCPPPVTPGTGGPRRGARGFEPLRRL
jgi:hypothetical protein